MNKKIFRSLIPFKIFRPSNRNVKSISDFSNRDLEQVFNFIYKRNYWKGKESISGSGSGDYQTRIVRKELNKILQRKDIKSVLDLPCGDFFWMSKMNFKDVNYIGGDIVEELVKFNNRKFGSSFVTFKKINIIKDDLPSIDLIFCRDCLVHFSFADIFS